jgi:hypothetical protein
MYLTEINKKTGLLIIDDIEDGIMAIKDFRLLVNDKRFGLACLTAVALVADYKSPIRYYSEEDRPRKAMEEVTGDRDAYTWKEDVIQLALKKYDSLQLDHNLKEYHIHLERKNSILDKLQDIDNPLSKTKRDGATSASLAKELRDINKDLEAFNKANQGKDLYGNSPVKGDYTLTRLEQLEDKKNSFYNTVR